MPDLINDSHTKILIAESDPIVALDLQGMVMRIGYDVVALADACPAVITAVKRFLPDVVLLDMTLKGDQDGIEIAREIQKDFDIPIIFCITTPDLSALVRAKELTYAAYLLKPISPDNLSTTLDTVLYKYKLEKRMKQTEARFQQLAEKEEILRFFMDDKSAFVWHWEKDGGVKLEDYDEYGIPEKVLEDHINAVIGGSASEKIATLLSIKADTAGDTFQFFTVIAANTPDGDRFSGLLIPLKEP
ncbi:response regulator [Brucepastera parasyntrophica]|uniref:response regulator n=1 Tax=Brucepastera parasyntrophica TaxID=2880008 RepID=UPI00210E949A|nr:response regulator [Brucepastera parasyntrophica]ULQ60318.1 response regulator [Brucepastera parasyntrophica]